MLDSVACTSAGNCTAVGTFQDSSGNTRGLMLEQFENGVLWTGGAQANATTNTGVALPSVSCSSTFGFCVAVGTYRDSSGATQGLLVSEENGAWLGGVQAPLPPDASTTNPLVSLTSGSCPSDDSCDAVGSYMDSSGNTRGLLLAESADTWSAVQAPAPTNSGANPLSSINALSCASLGKCTAVGSYVDSAGDQQGAEGSEFAGGLLTVEETTTPGNAATNPVVRLLSVSCATIDDCSAVGTYGDSSSHQQGLLVSESAGTWSSGVQAALPASAGADPSVALGSVKCASGGTARLWAPSSMAWATRKASS